MSDDIQVVKRTIGDREPRISIILTSLPHMERGFNDLIAYLTGLDCIGVEVVMSTGNVSEMVGKNYAARMASTDYLVFSNCGVYPSASMIAKTRRELDRIPTAVVEAYRIDITRSGGVLPNPFAIGDWQAVTRKTFEKLGGYSEDLLQCAGVDSDFLANAIAHGCEVILLDERVIHTYHSNRIPEDRYQRDAAENERRTKAKGWGQTILYYPDKAYILHGDSVNCLPVVAQSDTVLDVFPHQPRNHNYWDTIFTGKQKCHVFADSKISVDTDYPIACDSPDHLYPLGTVKDNSSNRAFVGEIEQLMPGTQLRILDLGCAGGQMIADFLTNGHVAVGLEGSDEPKKRGLHNWPKLKDLNLFNCDISRRFSVLDNLQPMKFDLVTAWDVMEHIPENRLDALFQNIKAHLRDGGLFMATIHEWSSPDEENGEEHHLTQKPQEWWSAKIAEYLKPVDYDVKHCPRYNPRWKPQVFRKQVSDK